MVRILVISLGTNVQNSSIDEPSTSQSLSEYLATLDGDSTRVDITGMFECAIGTLTNIHGSFGRSGDLPGLWVSSESTLNAGVVFGEIFVSKGLVIHCLNAKVRGFDEIMGIGFSGIDFDPRIVAKASLCWVVAHEYFHEIRSHVSAQKKVDGSDLTSQALEVDADLMAIAGIFRTNQLNYEGWLTPIHLRCLTLYAVFWIVRIFPNHGPASTHPTPAARLWLFVGKLAIVSESREPGAFVDADCQLTETRDFSRSLCECLVRCEKAFQQIHGAEAYGDLFVELKQMFEARTSANILSRWADIKGVVSELSGTVV